MNQYPLTERNGDLRRLELGTVMLGFRFTVGTQASLKALSYQLKSLFIHAVFRTVRGRSAKPVRLEP